MAGGGILGRHLQPLLVTLVREQLKQDFGKEQVLGCAVLFHIPNANPTLGKEGESYGENTLVWAALNQLENQQPVEETSRSFSTTSDNHGILFSKYKY